MKHSIASVTLLSFLLVSCGAPTDTQTPPEAIPFSVSAQSLGQFPKSYTVSKTGRLVGSSTISLTSQWVGRVESVLVKEGMSVKKGQVLVRLKDTTGNYDIRLSQSSNAVSSARNTFQSSTITLDKSIQDASIALERAKSDYVAAQANAENNLSKALRDAQKSDLNRDSSDANVTLAQLQASLEKSKLDYQNLRTSNAQTLLNYNTSFQTSLSDLKKLYNKLLFEGDRLYGITPKFQSENINIRRFLGSSTIRPTLEFAYYDLQKWATALESISAVPVNESNLILQLDGLAQQYKAIKAYLDTTARYLENSSIGAEFSQSQLDALIAVNNGYKSEVSGLENVWVTFRNGASSFLANYKNNEASSAATLQVQEKNIEVQKRQLQTSEFESGISLEKIKTANEQSITTSRLAVESAQANYDTALKNKELTLERLRLTESDASLGLSQAQEEFDKLSIRAPIDGSITRVSASMGQDVSQWTLLIEMANQNPEITFEVEAAIVPLLKVGETQQVKYEGRSYTGTIVGVSQVATDTLLYATRIIVSGNPSLLGQVATIELQLPTRNPVVPTDIVRVISDKKAEIQTLSGSQLLPVEVQIGRIAGSQVEIISSISEDTQIVTSNTSNFDPKKSKIQVTPAK